MIIFTCNAVLIDLGCSGVLGFPYTVSIWDCCWLCFTYQTNSLTKQIYLSQYLFSLNNGGSSILTISLQNYTHMYTTTKGLYISPLGLNQAWKYIRKAIQDKVKRKLPLYHVLTLGLGSYGAVSQYQNILYQYICLFRLPSGGPRYNCHYVP